MSKLLLDSTSMSSRKEIKICEVCGDSALGVNFDAICCESCKAFFRRNALKHKIVKCVYDGCCKIDVYKRRFCSFCRLQKCFNVGMKKDNILGENARKERMALVKLNREKKRKMAGTDDFYLMKKRKAYKIGADTLALIDGQSGSLCLENVASISLIGDIATMDTQSVDSGDLVEVIDDSDVKVEGSASANCIASCSGGGSSSGSDIDDTFDTVTRLSADAIASDSLGGAAFDLCDLGGAGGGAMGNGADVAFTSMIAASLKSCGDDDDDVPSSYSRQSVSKSPLPQTTNIVEFSKYITVEDEPRVSNDDKRDLSEFEQSTIQQLVDYYDLTFTVDLEPLIHLRQIDPSLSQLVNQASVTVLRIIKFAKRVEEFPHLPQITQIIALKSAWMQILLLRSVSLYDIKRNVWVTPKGDIPTGILKNATGFNELHDSHVCYCKSFKELIDDDLMIIVIIVVIVLFSAKGVHPSSRRLISNIQDKYLLLLKHYLEFKYGYTYAYSILPELMVKIKELDTLADEHSAYLSGLNPCHVEPIMLEILNKDL